jgi:hypothetical protein
MTYEGPTRPPVRVLRRVIVAVIIVSFAIAALGGIIVLLGGSLGPEAGRVLGTTAVVGAFSVAVLCCAALVGRRAQIFGMTGATIAVLAAIGVVWMIWYQGDYGDLSRVVWTAVALSVAFAFASLLLLLADREQMAVRIGLAVTLFLFAVVLAMTIYAIWWSDTIEGDAFGRVLGVFAILAALGAVIVPVVSLLLRAPRPRGGISDAARARLEAEAVRRGMTVDDFVEWLLAPSAPPLTGDDAVDPD